MHGMKVSRMREELADREAIRDCIYRYCRAIDRCDFDLLETIYWPEATEDHAPFKGSAADFMAWARTMLVPMDQTQHFVGNILIRIDGAFAYVETYIRAHHRLHGANDSRFDLVTSGRYVDRMERRDDEWRILSRTVVRDWFRQYPDSADWEEGVFGTPFQPGLRNGSDPSYELLNFTVENQSQGGQPSRI